MKDVYNIVRKNTLLLFLLPFFLFQSGSSVQTVEQRSDSLLHQMTTAAKIQQLHKEGSMVSTQ